MSLDNLLEELRHDREFMENVTAWERIPPRPAVYARFPDALDDRIVGALQKLGYAGLYQHQTEAIETVLQERNVVLATGTASGKSLAYHLPALHFVLKDPSASILYLFPTKALAQDQYATLSSLVTALESATPIPYNIYDGDTPRNHRARIRQSGGILISNPDMLHMGILPYHVQWSSFFTGLRLVVLDELHTYRGVFGSHMANVIRRLHRICRFYGTSPLFVCTSATITNAAEFAERLIGAPVVLVDEDASPTGERNIILYTPPMLDGRLGVRKSYVLEAGALTGRLVSAGEQVITFARTRLATEVLLGYIRDEMKRAGLSPVSARGYRGGYLPLERRDIERGLRDGEVRGVVATNALELGIDIGSMGAVVLAGYPGTIAATWQELGRAGRRATVSAGLLVASAMPLDQYIITHPRFLFEQPPEHALINPDNLTILVSHLRCAVYELPFVMGEAFGTLPDVEGILRLLTETGQLHADGDTYRWIASDYPAASISLRTAGNQPVIIQDYTDEAPIVIGQVDRESAPRVVYEGAIYLHESRQYIVEKLDWENGIAFVRPTEVDHYTNAISSTSVQIQAEFVSKPSGTCIKTHGHVTISQQVTGYRIIKRYTHETLGFGDVNLPPQQFDTTAYWITLTPDLTAKMEAINIILRPNDYGPNWQEQRGKARARDRYRCTHCGAPERDDRQHDVHHIRPFREYGYVAGENEAYREANQLANLVTLCASCHHTVEAIRHTQSALGGLATVLHNLAPLFLMCSPSDIGVVSEQKSVYSQLPTVTIYDDAPGGLGLAEQLFEIHTDLLKSALELVSDCPCIDGCPACIGPQGEVEMDTKQSTLILLKALLDFMVEED